MKKSYIARIFMVLTSLAVLIAMSGCAGGNASNELTDEQLLEMVEARGLEAGAAEEAEEVEAAEYMYVSTIEWTSQGTENVNISFPATWEYDFGNWGSLSFTGEGMTDPIFMGVHEFISATDILDSTGRFMEIVTEADSSQEFVFDDGHIGFMLEYPTSIRWVRADSWMAVNFSHGGARSHFVNNEELVLAIARSLTPTQPMQQGQETISDTQDQGLEQIASELVGLWTVTAPFFTFTEPFQEGDILSFFDDGTGFHDSPEFQDFVMAFTWHIEKIEGLSGATRFITPALFINHPNENQTISFYLHSEETIFDDPFGDGTLMVSLYTGTLSPFYLEPFMP